VIAAITVIAGVLGLLIGSFLNVVIYRVPAGKSIVAPPSACPTCEHPIRWYDNLPVTSWLALRGKCRDCGAPIAVRYPLVELGTAIFFAAVAIVLAPAIVNTVSTGQSVGAILVLVAFLYFAAVTIALALIDIDIHKLPNAIVFPSYLVATALFTAASFAYGDFSALLRAGITMAAFYVAYFLMAFSYPGGMGMGDVKLAGVVGIYLGWVGLGAALVGGFAAFVMAGIYALVLILMKRANRKSGIPFGPWMLAGAWLGVGVGNLAFAGYLSLMGLTVQ